MNNLLLRNALLELSKDLYPDMRVIDVIFESPESEYITFRVNLKDNSKWFWTNERIIELSFLVSYYRDKVLEYFLE
jgi:hypothetical protein